MTTLPFDLNHRKDWSPGLLDQGDQDLGTNGPYVDLFAEQIADMYRVSHNQIFLTNSGTSALEIALQNAKVDRNSLVLMSTMSFVACQNVVLNTGSEIYYYDIDPETLLMRIDKNLLEHCEMYFSRGERLVNLSRLQSGRSFTLVKIA
jgi:hypothetical protein